MSDSGAIWNEGLPTLIPGRVSFLLPFRDAATTLPRCLASIDQQTYSDVEVVLVDDASSDGSSQIARDWADSRRGVRLIRSDRNLGIGGALALGQSEIRGEFTARIDADDYSHPERLREQVAVLLTERSLVALATESSAGRLPVPHGHAPIRDVGQSLLEGQNVISHPSVLLRTEALRQVGGYRPKFSRAQDYDLWLRLLDIGSIAILEKPLVTRGYSTEQATRRLLVEGYFMHPLALASRNARLDGRPDPVDGWNGEVDIDVLLNADISPLSMTRVVAELAHATLDSPDHGRLLNAAFVHLAQCRLSELALLRPRLLAALAVRPPASVPVRSRVRLSIAATGAAGMAIPTSLRALIGRAAG